MGTLSRRDFLTLRRTERGRVLDVSCRTFYMRCADADTAQGSGDAWEPWMGEPPAAWERPPVDDLVSAFEADLAQAQVLRLREVEWLDRLPALPRLDAAIAAFRSGGGIVESDNERPA